MSIYFYVFFPFQKPTLCLSHMQTRKRCDISGMYCSTLHRLLGVIMFTAVCSVLYTMWLGRQIKCPHQGLDVFIILSISFTSIVQLLWKVSCTHRAPKNPQLMCTYICLDGFGSSSWARCDGVCLGVGFNRLPPTSTLTLTI